MRTSHGLTRSLLASKLLISASGLSKYETGDRTPDIHTLKKLAAFFEVSVDYILEMGSFHRENGINTSVSLLAEKAAVYIPSDEEYQWLSDMRSLTNDQLEIMKKQLAIFLDFNARMKGGLVEVKSAQKLSGCSS